MKSSRREERRRSVDGKPPSPTTPLNSLPWVSHLRLRLRPGSAKKETPPTGQNKQAPATGTMVTMDSVCRLRRNRYAHLSTQALKHPYTLTFLVCVCVAQEERKRCSQCPFCGKRYSVPTWLDKHIKQCGAELLLGEDDLDDE